MNESALSLRRQIVQLHLVAQQALGKIPERLPASVSLGVDFASDSLMGVSTDNIDNTQKRTHAK